MPTIETGVGYLLLVPMATAFAVVTAPNTADIPAVLGAVLASTIVVLDAIAAARTRVQAVSAFIASAVVGSVLPGGIIYFWWPERAATLTWHAWAGLGFVAGLGGWALSHALMKLFANRAPDLVDKAANAWLGKVPSTPPQPPPSEDQ